MSRFGHVDVDAALAGWRNRVRADLTGCYENPVWCRVRLGLSGA